MTIKWNRIKTHLNCSSKGNYFIRIDSNIGILPGQFLNKFLDSWNTCGTTNKDYFIKIFEREFGVP